MQMFRWRGKVSVCDLGARSVSCYVAGRCGNKLWQCRSFAVSVTSVVVSVGELRSGNFSCSGVLQNDVFSHKCHKI